VILRFGKARQGKTRQGGQGSRGHSLLGSTEHWTWISKDPSLFRLFKLKITHLSHSLVSQCDVLLAQHQWDTLSLFSSALDSSALYSSIYCKPSLSNASKTSLSTRKFSIFHPLLRRHLISAASPPAGTRAPN
jgi:hypothetical protein